MNKLAYMFGKKLAESEMAAAPEAKDPYANFLYQPPSVKDTLGRSTLIGGAAGLGVGGLLSAVAHKLGVLPPQGLRRELENFGVIGAAAGAIRGSQQLANGFRNHMSERVLRAPTPSDDETREVSNQILEGADPAVIARILARHNLAGTAPKTAEDRVDGYLHPKPNVLKNVGLGAAIGGLGSAVGGYLSLRDMPDAGKLTAISALAGLVTGGIGGLADSYKKNKNHNAEKAFRSAEPSDPQQQSALRKQLQGADERLVLSLLARHQLAGTGPKLAEDEQNNKPMNWRDVADKALRGSAVGGVLGLGSAVAADKLHPLHLRHVAGITGLGALSGAALAGGASYLRNRAANKPASSEENSTSNSSGLGMPLDHTTNLLLASALGQEALRGK